MTVPLGKTGSVADDGPMDDAAHHAVGLLLAAGASRRFGADDKLLAPLAGRPLIAHAAQAMRQATLTHRIAVIANPALIPHLHGFQIVTIPPGTQSDSLRAGVAAAGTPYRLLIALGDMPDITPDLLNRVCATATDTIAAAAVQQGIPMPPACFPAAMLPRLAALTGDQGAGRLLQNLPPRHMIAAPNQLRDIDTPPDLTHP